jgi:hypothetical protein
MSFFDQRGQHVTNQYNAQHMNFGSVQNKVDLIAELEKFKEEVSKSQKDGTLDKKKATDVEYQITKATQEAEEAKPDKKTILDHLATAKSLLEGMSAASGFVSALASAIETVRKFFP